jgi:hypothetical protein
MLTIVYAVGAQSLYIEQKHLHCLHRLCSACATAYSKYHDEAHLYPNLLFLPASPFCLTLAVYMLLHLLLVAAPQAGITKLQIDRGVALVDIIRELHP